MNGAAGDYVKSDRQFCQSAKKFNANNLRNDDPHESHVTRRRIRAALAEVDPEERAITLRSRKSVTLCDIMSPRRKTKMLASGAPTTMMMTTPTPRRDQDARHDAAGRRVYQRLLLNAWRRRRTEVAQLTESSQRLHLQVKQLHMQVDVLQQLRRSESKRRSEASLESIVLKMSLEKDAAKIRDLETEIERYKETETKLKEKLDELTVDFRNIANDLDSCRNDMQTYERRLNGERDKLRTVNEDNAALMRKIGETEQTLSAKIERIRELEGRVTCERERIRKLARRNEDLSAEKQKLSMSLEGERDKCRLLENRLRNECDKSKTKIAELKRSVAMLRDVKRSLADECGALRESFDELMMENLGRKTEEQRSWLRRCARFFVTTVHLMLPALPPPPPE